MQGVQQGNIQKSNPQEHMYSHNRFDQNLIMTISKFQAPMWLNFKVTWRLQSIRH